MPLFVFRCGACNREFEELCNRDDIEKKECPDCGNMSERKVATSFGISTRVSRGDTLVSRKEIDKAVGAAAEKNWQGYDERWKSIYKKIQEERRSGKEIKEVILNPDKSGRVVPFENLGDRKEQVFRKKYSAEYTNQITNRNKDGNKTPVIIKNSG